MRRVRWVVLLTVVAAIALVAVLQSCDSAPEPVTPSSETPSTDDATPTRTRRRAEPIAPAAPESPPEAVPEEVVNVDTGTIVGTVSLADGTPAGKAKLLLVPGGNWKLRQVVEADESGAFRAEELPSGTWSVRAGGGGYGTRVDRGVEPAVAEVRPGEEVRVAVIAEPLVLVRGRVTGPDGEPVVGADISIQCDAFLTAESSCWVLELKTDDDGRFSRPSVTPDGYVRVDVNAAGYAMASRKLAGMTPGEPTDVDFTLQTATVLELLLVDDADGSPVTDAIVWITDTGEGGLYESEHGDHFEPDENGRVRADTLRPRSVRVQIDPKRHVRPPKRVFDPTAETEPVTVRLTLGKSISGHLWNADGTPAAGRSLRASDPSLTRMQAMMGNRLYAEVADDGSFRFDRVPEGTWVVSLSTNRGIEVVSARADAGATGVVLRLPADAIREVTVRIVGPTGERVPRVRTREGHMTRDGGMLSSAGGRLGESEEVVEVGGRALAFVEAWDARDENGARLPYGHVFAVVPEDCGDEHTIVMQAERVITGRVVDSDGNGVGGASISVTTVPNERRDGSLTEQIDTVLARSDGSFRVGGLGDETVLLRPVADGFVGDASQVTAGATDVRLAMESALVPLVTVLTEDGRAVAGASVSVYRVLAPDADAIASFPREPVFSGETDSNGQLRLQSLRPNGRYEVRIRPAQRGSGLLPAKLDDWQPQDTEIRLLTARLITGRVKTASGATPSEWTGSALAMLDGSSVSYATIESDGTFRLPDVPMQSVTVEVTAGTNDELTGSADAPVGTTEVVVDLTSK